MQRILTHTDSQQSLKTEAPKVEVLTHEPVKTEVPPARLFGRDLKKLKGYKNLRSTHKNNTLKETFIHDLQIVLLNEYDPLDVENDLSDELLIEVMQLAENFFFYPKDEEEREALKMDCVVKLMTPYFRNDRKLLLKTVEHIRHNVKKCKLWKRLFFRFKHFFLKII